MSQRAGCAAVHSEVYTVERDTIAEIALDDAGQLHVVPSAHAFNQVYREALEVHWNASRRSLHSPRPRQWSYPRWFQQIRLAAREQGCDLRLGADTRWVNVAPSLQAEIRQIARIEPGFE
jgi:hypothetical protein